MRRNVKKLVCLLMAVMLTLACFGSAAWADESGFTLRLTGRLEGDGAQELNDILDTSSIELAGKGEDGSGVLNYEVRIGGQSLLKVLSKISSGHFAFSMPGVDDNCYEISGEDFLNILGSAVTTQDGQALSDVLPQMPELPEITPEELEEVIAPYLNLISEHLREVVEIREDTSVPLERLGKEAQGDLMIYEPEAQQLAALLQDAADLVEKDEKLMDVAEKLSVYFESLGGLVTFSSSYASDLSGEDLPDGEEMTDSIKKFFEELPDALRSGANDLMEGDPQEKGLRLSAGLSDGPDGMPLLLRFETLDDQPACIGFESLGREQGRDTSLYLNDGTDDWEMRLADSSVGAVQQGTLYVSYNGGNVLTAVYNWDQSRRSLIGVPYGNCMITADPVMMSVTVTDADAETTSHRLMVTGLESLTNGEPEGLTLDLATSADAQVEEPSGETVDLGSYGPDDFSGLLERIVDHLMETMELIGE